MMNSFFRSFAWLVFLLAQSALANSAPLSGKWKIESYSIAKISTWGDDEARPMLKKAVTFGGGGGGSGLTIGKHSCTGKIAPVSDEQANSLKADLMSEYCSKGKVAGEIYDNATACGGAVKLAPYIAKLSNGKLLAFGDGIEFCLSKSK